MHQHRQQEHQRHQQQGLQVLAPPIGFKQIRAVRNTRLIIKLPKGIYFAKIQSENLIKTEKI